MKKTHLIFIILVLLIGLSACDNNAAAPSGLESDGGSSTLADTLKQENYMNSSSILESKINEVRHKLLTGYRAETSEEIFDIFVFLLEHGRVLSDNEIAQARANWNSGLGFDFDSATVWHTYYWYKTNALDNLSLQVLDRGILLADRGEVWTGISSGGTDFFLTVDVTDNGGMDIPLGVQEWVFQTVFPPWGVVGPVPQFLITKDEYNFRVETNQYAEEKSLLTAFMVHYFGAFDSFQDVPDDSLTDYILVNVRDGLTREELDTISLELFGIARLEPENRKPDPETGLYFIPGFGPPIIWDFFWRVSEDENGVHLDYIWPYVVALRYTVKDGRVIRAIDISNEIEGVAFGVIGG